MGQVLHGSATTTEAVRRAIQHSQESLRALAKRYGINQKTVAKWKKRTSVADLPTGPKEPKSTVLSIEEEAIIVAFRQAYAAAAGRLPLCASADDPAPDAFIPASLPATAWHLPVARRRRRQAAEEEVQELPDRLLPHRYRRGADRRRQALSLRRHRSHLQVRLRAQLHEKAGSTSASAFLRRPDRGRALQDPHRAHRQRHPVHYPAALRQRSQQRDTSPTCSTCVCRENGIEHRLTKINHPWTNGQVERMNRTIKEATVKRFHYDSPRPAATATFPTSSTPTISAGGSRPSRASRHTNSSANAGLPSQNDSSSILSIKCRD